MSGIFGDYGYFGGWGYGRMEGWKDGRNIPSVHRFL
jgi:hypothetical protein